MDIENIWTHEKKIKIATGLTLKETNELIGVNAAIWENLIMMMVTTDLKKINLSPNQ